MGYAIHVDTSRVSPPSSPIFPVETYFSSADDAVSSGSYPHSFFGAAMALAVFAHTVAELLVL